MRIDAARVSHPDNCRMRRNCDRMLGSDGLTKPLKQQPAAAHVAMRLCRRGPCWGHLVARVVTLTGESRHHGQQAPVAGKRANGRTRFEGRWAMRSGGADRGFRNAAASAAGAVRCADEPHRSRRSRRQTAVARGARKRLRRRAGRHREGQGVRRRAWLDGGARGSGRALGRAGRHDRAIPERVRGQARTLSASHGRPVSWPHRHDQRAGRSARRGGSGARARQPATGAAALSHPAAVRAGDGASGFLYAAATRVALRFSAGRRSRTVRRHHRTRRRL